MNRTYIVVWSVGDGPDEWRACDTFEEAQAMYADLLARDDLFSASICRPVRSTDYDCEEV